MAASMSQLREPSVLPNLSRWPFLSGKTSLFSWSFGMFSFNTWVWQAFSDTELPTVNSVWVNSSEHCSWTGSGHMYPSGASQIIPHPVPAQRSFSSAVTTASQSHTHAFYFQSWSFECGYHPNVPPLCCAPLFTFVFARSFWRWAWEMCGHLSPSGEGGGALTAWDGFQYPESSAWGGHKISEEEMDHGRLRCQEMDSMLQS